MIFDYQCLECDTVFEKITDSVTEFVDCKCGGKAVKVFHATTNFHVPSYFHTSKSDIFSDTEWADLKKNPNIERA